MSPITTFGTLPAFVVIPACAAQFFCRGFVNYVRFSAILGAASAVIGMVFSACLNLPSGPSIVVTQLAIFLGAIAFPHGSSR
ncbi:MAG: hypothetical protein F6K19_38365 [Cyanothece sp. SIO1E1]|nr:hypothetical protein [Cyanothece sp. SIO1E1]